MPATRDSLISAEANRRMFDGIASRYDLLNALLSLGLDRRWRRRAVSMLGPRGGERYLDVGCGTGDVAIEILRQAPDALVAGVDPAAQMLALARTKTEKAGVAKWTPGQLRHNAGARIRSKHGLEAARLILGHQSMATTEIYAEKDMAKAIRIMEELG